MTGTTPRKLLLTSVSQPFGQKYGDGFGVSYEGSHQLMWAQGIFRPRATTTQWGIEFIAANLQIPTTTLHYPTMKRFVAELKKGYDYVGIAFVSPTLHKLIPMVRAVRKHAPSTKVILGGYGTALDDATLAPLSDHICRGEGVNFMRRLLGENEDAPIVQPDITQTSRLFSLKMIGKTGYVLAGLGCPNGCDFCATSHYFKRRHVAFLGDGPSLIGAIHQLRESHPGMTNFWINDEDFLLNQKRGRGFLEEMRRSSLPPLSISVFSSVKALSQYDPAELVEMGIDWVWIGFEGKRAGYSKMEGRSYPDLFADLKRHGISVLASMIIGFDYQTPEIIREEFEELMALRPSISQFLIYSAAHGTPLFDKLKAEGRLDPEVYADNRLHDGFTLGFKHPHIGRDRMSEIQRGLYKEEFQRLGPSVFRMTESYLDGYLTMRDNPSPRVRAKAAKLASLARSALPVLNASRRYVSPVAGDWLRGFAGRIVQETGPSRIKERFLSLLAPALLLRETIKLRLGIGQQPEFSRRSYRFEGMPILQSLGRLTPEITFNPQVGQTVD